MTLIALTMLAANPLADLPEVVLLDFTASYCRPCQEMVPAVQQMQKQNYPVRKVDITEYPEISEQFHVERIPTFVLLVNGQEKKRIVGKCSGRELMQLMLKARDDLRTQRPSDDTAVHRRSASEVAAEDRRPGGLQRLFAMIREGFGGRSQNQGFLHPTFRAQSPAPPPVDTAGENAMAATVRVRVTKSKNKEDIGTGSIIHSTAESSTILTCAHLLRDPAQGSTVEVEVFRDGQTYKYPADIVTNKEDLDLAILRIRNSSPLATVELAPESVEVRSSDAAFSIGCNHGQLPTHMPVRVVDVNRYKGPPSNIVCTVDPVVGRSGGGLFNAGGQLIGVCSCADRKHHEGLYMDREAVRSLFASAKLSHLLIADRESDRPSEFSPEPDRSEDDLIAAIFTDDDSTSADEDEFAEPASAFETPVAETDAERKLAGRRTSVLNHSDARQFPSREITVIVDSLDGSRPKEVVVIKRPSPWLLELLTGEATESQPAVSARRDERSSDSRHTSHTLQPAAMQRSLQSPRTRPVNSLPERAWFQPAVQTRGVKLR